MQNAKCKMQNAKRNLIAGFSLILAGISFNSYGQNTLPSTGNVGIGTTAPSATLQVNGTAKIDSALLVKDSIVVNKTARIKSDLKVDGKATLKGDVVIKEGTFKIKPLGDTSLAEPGVLLVDANGKVTNGGDVKSLVYAVDPLPACKDGDNGYTTPANPVWLNASGVLYTSRTCVPNAKVGIGVPYVNDTSIKAKLHIKTNEIHFPDTKAILVVDHNNVPQFQVNPDGLVYAREIKVNLDAAWPDYVFEAGYQLMTLEELADYIRLYGHLPHVPSAEEMKEQGVNVAETNVMLMEKVEELTLYLLQLQQEQEEQEALILQQQEVLKQQQETLRLQQLLLEQLQQNQTTVK